MCYKTRSFCHNHYPAQTTTMLPKKATRLYTVVNSLITILMCLLQGNCTVPINGIWLQLLYAAKNYNSYNMYACHHMLLTFYKGTVLHTHQLNLRTEQFLKKQSCKFAAVTLWLYSYMTVYSSLPVPWFVQYWNITTNHWWLVLGTHNFLKNPMMGLTGTGRTISSCWSE